MLENVKDNKAFDMRGKVKHKMEPEPYSERQTGTPQ